jgi:metal-responsive CopG/Arc/MetJ family transcriptional regulator
LAKRSVVALPRAIPPRSEFFRQAIQAFLNDLQRREDVERYVKGYLEYPEQPLDAAFHASLLATLEEWSSPEDEEAFRDL